MKHEKYQIMVIEDNPKHLEDVRGLITPREDLVEAVYATNLAEALELLNFRKPDGVLSDAHFPKAAGGPEEPFGIDMIDYAMERKMPFTIVTSAYHHGTKTQPVHERAVNSGIGLVDCYIEGDKEGEASSKRWDEGLVTLIFLIDKTRAGQIIYEIMPEMRGQTDGKHVGMMDVKGQAIRFSLPPYQKDVLDEIKQRLRLE